MFLCLVDQFGYIQMCAFLRRKRGTVVEIIEKVLIWIRPSR